MEKLAVLILLCVVLAACNSIDKNNPVIPDSAVDIAKANGSPPSAEEKGLHAVKQKISEHLQEIEERHSIKIQMLGLGQDHVMVQIRPSGNVERALSEADIEAVKKTMFELAGSAFPIRMSVWTCCAKEADITGKIAQIDKKQNRLLIVNERKKNGNTDNPEAVWVTLAPDGILAAGGSAALSGFDESMIGREARAWSTGVMLQSYPGQTSAVKVAVE